MWLKFEERNKKTFSLNYNLSFICSLLALNGGGGGGGGVFIYELHVCEPTSG